MILTKIKYVLFIVLLFMQNFALISTTEFGINGLVIYLFILSLIDFKDYYLRIKKSVLLILITVIFFLLISGFVNNSFVFSQILRTIMIVWLVYTSNIFIKNVYTEKNGKLFFDIFIKVAFVFFLYGFYEFYANKHSFPLFLNVFNNNPSYGVRGLNMYYHGWVNKTRLYNAFFEPSAFCIFSVYMLFFISTFKNLSRFLKLMMISSIIFNIYFTYARSGDIVMFYFLLIFIIYGIFRIKSDLIDYLFLLLPFINLLIMSSFGLQMFTDDSSYIRTYSALYYLGKSFSSIKYVLFGHASGGVLIADTSHGFVTNCAHNGYVDFLYQYGVVFLILFVIFLKKLIGSITNYKFKFLFVGVVTTAACFGNYFLIETFVVILVLFYNYCLYQCEENVDDY